MSNKERDLLEFGPFRIDPSRRLLFRDNNPIPLQAKAFDTLLVLVRNSERVVPKEDLMNSVWPDAFVEESNLTQNIFVLRKILGETRGERRYIVTVPGRGYRFAEKVRTIAEPVAEDRIPAEIVPLPPPAEQAVSASARTRMWRVIAPAAAVILALGLAVYRYFPRSPRLTEKSTIVLADFANVTGDPIFDGTLRQGLAAQLEQSPYLNLLSDQRIAQTLSLMAQPKDAALTAALAREVCQRTGSTAVLNGAIEQFGARYLLTLKAINCADGEALASANEQATDKSHVLDALGKIALEIRRKLGESLASLEKYAAPPENVTTPSLEALKAYSAGYQTMIVKNDYPGAIPLFQRAIGLDPSFAMAYARLGINYYNMDEPGRAAENLGKAYELRERLSEREKLYIAASHEAMATGNMEAARKTYDLWSRIYPRDQFAIGNLAVVESFLGEYGRSLSDLQEAWKLNAGNALVLTNIVNTYIELNRLDEAEATAREAQARHQDSALMHAKLYLLRRDKNGMEREAAALLGKPGWEDLILYYESDTAACAGQFAKSRELTRRAAESAQRADKKETAAAYLAEAAVREALAANWELAKTEAKAALASSDDREVETMSALASGLAGESAQALRLAADLARRFPEDTIVQFNSLPSIRAGVALGGGDGAKAIQHLSASLPYELGQTSQSVSFVLYPIYLRGESYLAAKHGLAASVEFQRILEHPGLAQNEPIGALAHLGLGRAYALSAETAKAKEAYGEFLNLWRDGDPELPVLRQARAEYAKLTAKQ
jgi:DNA-binding winged helix-turn-helix (wHTH) protein/tetratricopeptide (TPR) repeat protein